MRATVAGSFAFGIGVRDETHEPRLWTSSHPKIRRLDSIYVKKVLVKRVPANEHNCQISQRLGTNQPQLDQGC